MRTQTQVLVISLEILGEVRNRLAVRMCVVDAESAAYIDVLDDDLAGKELFLQFVHPVTQGDEVAHVQNL